MWKFHEDAGLVLGESGIGFGQSLECELWVGDVYVDTNILHANILRAQYFIG